MDVQNIKLQMQADILLGQGDVRGACALYEVAATDAETKGRGDTAKLLRERIEALTRILGE